MCLVEYTIAVKKHCSHLHNERHCAKCKPVIMAAQEIMGNVPLSTLYKKCFGSVYKSDKAARRLIQLPVIIFRAFHQLFVNEYIDGIDFAKLVSCVSKHCP